MAREIKFRGKRMDKLGKGKWVYGSLLTLKHAVSKDPSMLPMIMDDKTGATYAVDPETVGQYTGMRDRNGADIYEGQSINSIVKNKYREPYDYIVGWEQSQSRFVLNTPKDGWFNLEQSGAIPQGNEYLEIVEPQG